MNKQIFRLAIPYVLSNLSTPLLSSVDTALMGHLPGVYYIGAIGVGSTIFNNLFWAFIFLRLGTCGIAAQAFGSGNREETATALCRGLFIGLIFGLAFILFQKPIAAVCFKLIPSTAEVEHHAHRYFDIRMLSAPAALANYAMQGWFMGMQNALYPSIIIVFINVLNLILSIVFVKDLAMTSEGVALGSVIAQYAGLLVSWVLLRLKYSDYLTNINAKAVTRLSGLMNYMKLNFDIFLRTLCLLIVFTFFMRQSAQHGEVILAANNILLQLWLFYAFGIDGFANAAESLSGKFKGAGDLKSLKTCAHWLFFWGAALGWLTTGVYSVFKTPILNLYTNQPDVIRTAMEYYDWVIGGCLILFYPFVWDGIYIGAVATKAMRNTMVFATFGVYFPAYFLLAHVFKLGNVSLWISLVLFMAARGAGQAVLAKKEVFSPGSQA